MEKRKIDLEGFDYVYYRVVFGENGKVIGVEPAIREGDNVFPMLFPEMEFLSNESEETHDYAIIYKDGVIAGICYDRLTAFKFCKAIGVYEKCDMVYELVPVVG